jgi:hypothetical protein
VKRQRNPTLIFNLLGCASLHPTYRYISLARDIKER